MEKLIRLGCGARPDLGRHRAAGFQVAVGSGGKLTDQQGDRRGSGTPVGSLVIRYCLKPAMLCGRSALVNRCMKVMTPKASPSAGYLVSASLTGCSPWQRMPDYGESARRHWRRSGRQTQQTTARS
jgi:hypothetical protein